MKHGTHPKTKHRNAHRDRKFTILVLYDPIGDLTGLLMNAYEFAYGPIMGVWADGTQFVRMGKHYELIGTHLYHEGNAVQMQSWDPTGIIGRRWQARQ